MKIDKTTPYDSFAALEPFMAAGEIERLEKTAVSDMFGADGFMAMSVGHLLDAIRGDVSSLLRGGGDTVFDVYRVRAFARFLSKFVDDLKALTPPPTAEDATLSQGTIPRSFDEAVYCFCRSYFQLPTFAAVDDLKIADYVLAKRDDYNRTVVERNMAKMMKGYKK